ncbi:MAG: GGDEF domain-containing response regulator [Labilithrix sp.]|nr:GGDEF domain-containing response regulator [Labilithrix sp.]MCW5815862.1 GGDEF domain-containing response regulator [Labilithrix sp.]
MTVASRRVVLIDPVTETRNVFAQRLRAHGYVVDDAADAVAGAEMSLADPPSAIVCDLWMPGVSGVQLCRLLSAEPGTEDVPIILRSEVDDPRSRFWSRHAGARALVMKGRMGELVRALDDVLEEEEESTPFFFRMSGGAHDIRDRIAENLDRALFASVVAAEVRSLAGSSALDRMFDSLSQLLTQLVDYRWVALTTTAPVYFAIHAHRRQAEAAEREAAKALAIAPETSRMVRIHDDDARDVDAAARTLVYDLTLGGSRLGRIAFGVPAGPSRIDKIAPLVAQELPAVVRLVLLVEESQRLATTDGLTGLMNRRAFVANLRREMDRAMRTGTATSVLLLDLDHFKAINDTHGHGAGDAVLVAVAQTLQRVSRTYDLVGRWGGEEFVIALPGTDEERALIVAERMRDAIEKLVVTNARGTPMPLSASIGAAELSPGPVGESLDSLVDRADRAMYSAKVGGRNRVCRAEKIQSATPVSFAANDAA